MHDTLSQRCALAEALGEVDIGYRFLPAYWGQGLATEASRPAIESACADLMSLMFPGFRGEAVFDSGDLPDVTRSRMRNLHNRLKPEICKSFGNYPASDETQRKAEELLDFFMSELRPLRKMLWTDIDAAFEGDPAATSYEEVHST